MKKLFALIMIGILSCSMCITVTATDEGMIVSNEEIRSSIQNILSKYDVSYKLENGLNSKSTYTRSEVDIELKKLEDSIRDIQKYIYIGTIESTPSSTRVMETTKQYVSYINVSNGALAGNATIEISCTGRINMGSMSFMSISNINTRQYGQSFNFVSWAQRSSRTSSTDGNRTAFVEVVGTLTTSCNILGQALGMANDYTIGMYINA